MKKRGMEMKRLGIVGFAVAAVLLLSLCGCSMIPNILSESRIETLKSWSFQYNSGTDDYSLFFALCDESDK